MQDLQHRGEWGDSHMGAHHHVIPPTIPEGSQKNPKFRDRN